MCADEVRARCGTTGPVRLFTSPWTFGYVQNPISVYYCYEGDVADCSADTLKTCVAEVTNTPWGERVVFNFEPTGQRVPKALHVSPFMDMLGDWDITASHPGPDMTLNVNVVAHPVWARPANASN